MAGVLASITDDRIARPNAAPRQRGGQTPRAPVELGVGVLPAAVDHREAPGIDRGRALEERQWRERLKIGGTLVEVLCVGIDGHGFEISKGGASGRRSAIVPAQPRGPAGRTDRPNVLDRGQSSKMICIPRESCGKLAMPVGARGHVPGGRGAKQPVSGGTAWCVEGRRGHGETAAGAARRGWRSAGLMQRLADLHRDGAPRAADCPLRARPPTGRKLRPFAVGLLGSLAVGVAAFALIATRLKVEAGRPPSAAGAASAWQDRPQPVALDLPILKSDQPAAFPLLVTGLDGAGEARIVLQHLPEAVWFSRGERRDEHTWELARADLDDLCVTLRPGTPPAFMVGIEVIDANTAILAQTSAAVRLIEAGASADVAGPPLSVTANSLRPDHGVAPQEGAALTWSTPTVTRQGVAREGRMRPPRALAIGPCRRSQTWHRRPYRPCRKPRRARRA